jgi:hypothetical protein
MNDFETPRERRRICVVLVALAIWIALVGGMAAI